MNIKTSDRIDTVHEYYFSRKLREIEQLKDQLGEVINLGIGSPDISPEASVVNTLIDSAKNTYNHSYQSYKGVLELRQAISKWYKRIYQVNLDAEREILPLMGSKEGIMHVSMTYVDYSDEVLIPDPGYPTYASATKLAGGKVVTYDLLESKNWQPCIDQLSKLITPKTKLIWLNYPHMPTGQPADLHGLKKVLELAKANDILVCNDNPYSLTLSNKPTSIFQIETAKEVAIELNSLSKSHSMSGWRVGWLSGNEKYVEQVLKFKSNMDSGMFLPIQHAAIKALNLSAAYFKEVNEIYENRRQLVWKLLDRLGCSYVREQVGMFVWAKIPSNIIDSASFSDIILYNYGVFITPGNIFGRNGARYIRISLCATEKKLNDAIVKIEKGLGLKNKRLEKLML